MPNPLIKGKNGSGKSTLLRTIAGLTPIEGGEINQNGVNIFHAKEQWVRKLIFIDNKNGLSDVDRLHLMVQGGKYGA